MKIFTVSVEDLPFDFTYEDNSSYHYNNYLYINTPTKIFKYDYINNRVEILLNKSTQTTSFCIGIEDNLYIVEHKAFLSAYSGYTKCILHIYNITNGTYIESPEYDFNTNGGLVDYYYMLYYDDGKIILRAGLSPQYQNYGCAYNIISNSFDNLGCDDVKGYNPNQNYFNTYLWAERTQYKTGSVYPYQSNVYTNSNLPQRGSLIIEDGDYYIIGTLNEQVVIYKGNPTSNVWNEVDVKADLPDSFYKHSLVHYNNNNVIFHNGKKYNFAFEEWSLTYSIKSFDGETTYAVHTDCAPITKVLFGFDGYTCSYVLTTLAGEITGTFTPNKIDGKILSGFSSSVKPTKAAYQLNKEQEVNIDKDFTFYEYLSNYHPLDTNLSINIYQNSSEPNRLDKTAYLKSVGTLNGTFREPTSLTNPTITIQQDDVPTFNYIYISAFNRYYYVTEIVSIRRGLWQIDCTVDVLMSYKDAIRECPARVERNQYIFNDLIPDNRRIVECGSNITDNQISNTVFNQTGNYQFVMNGYKINAVVG